LKKGDEGGFKISLILSFSPPLRGEGKSVKRET